jgi:RNA polymerase sigma-70 factor (ECF subfamily)
MVTGVVPCIIHRMIMMTTATDIDTTGHPPQAVFRHGVDAWYPAIYRHIVASTYGSGLDADDLTQDVFLKAWRKIDSFDSRSSMKTWLYAIARTTVLDALRRRKIRSVMSFFSDKGPAFQPDGDAGDTTAELRHQLRLAIAGLPESYRTVLLCRDVDGLSYADIAAITGETEGTLRSRHFEARKRLRDTLTRNGITP